MTISMNSLKFLLVNYQPHYLNETLSTLLATGTKIKALLTRQKTLEKKPHEDVSKTISNFLTPSKPFKNGIYSLTIQHGIEKESEAKTSYCKIMNFNLSHL